MSLSSFQILCAALGALILLAGGFIWVAVSMQGERLRTLEARTLEQALTLQAAQAAQLLLWAETPDGSLHVSPSPLLPSQGPPLTYQDLLEAIPSEARTDLHQAVEALGRNPEARRVVRLPFLAPGGESLITVWALRREAGRLQGVVRDITAEVQVQHQLIQAQRREAVASLIAGISHEFGNVLGAVDSCATALLAQPIEGEARRAGELIQASAQRGRGVIRQLLDLSHPRPSQPALTDLNQIMRDLERLLANLLPKQIHVALDLDPELPCLVLDPALLHQALMNLSLNARDAMPKGGSLTLRSRKMTDQLTLEVMDTGQGMDEATLARLFEPFFTTKEPGRGTGLGMSITREILEGMGAELNISSVPEVGTQTRISFSIPKMGFSPSGSEGDHRAEGDPDLILPS